MKPFQAIGNKRSGTTLLCSLVNCHPDLWMAFEQDVMWILYQCRDGDTRDFCGFWLDTPYSMWGALHSCENYNTFCRIEFAGNRREAIVKAYYEASLRLMRKVQPKRKEPTWIGDKKPVQCACPSVNEFIVDHFPDVRFLHVIRHPRAVVGSHIAHCAYPLNPRFWYGTADEIFARWATHEQWVLEAKERAPTLTLKYEDLCENPIVEMRKVFEFLGVYPDLASWYHIRKGVKRSANYKYTQIEIPMQPLLREIMDVYGYKET